MPLDRIDESLLLAAWFRGRCIEDEDVWTSNADQIITLSLFYTGDISAEECARRFSHRSYISKLYGSDGELTEEIAVRDQALVALVRSRPDLLAKRRGLDNSLLPHVSSVRIDDRRCRSGT